MSQGKLLTFDLMDTVVVDPFYREVMSYLQTTLAELAQIKHPTSWLEFETGKIDEKDFLSRFYKENTSLKITQAEQFKQVFFNAYRFVDGMEELLTQLRAENRKLWVLSNYSPWFEVIRDRLSLDRFFTGYCLSYQTGYRKPDPRAYRALFQQASCLPKDCLLIDDRAINVEAALQEGMSCHYFEDAVSLREALRKQNIL